MANRRAKKLVVLHRECASSREIVVTHEGLDSPEVLCQGVGKGAGLTHQTSDALPSRRRKTRAGIGCPGVLRARPLRLCRPPPFRDGSGVRLARRRGPGPQRQSGPERRAALPTPRPHGAGPALTRGRLHGDPPPGCVGVRRHAAPPLVRGRGHSGHPHGGWPGGALAREGRGPGRAARAQTGPAPRQTDPSRTAETAPCQACASHRVDPLALLVRPEAVVGRGTQRAGARLTLRRRLPMAGRAMVRVPA